MHPANVPACATVKTFSARGRLYQELRLGTSFKMLTALVSLVGFVITAVSIAQRTQVATRSAPAVSQGRQIFASSCGACHGLDGRGGERAPNIASSAEVQKLSDADLVRVLQNGITGAGMPSFASLGTTRIRAVVAYLRVLQNKNGVAHLPGDPARGQSLFTGKGHCSECHMVNGQGGFLASDLSSYAAGRSVDEIRATILDPGKDPDRRSKRAIVVTSAGAKLEGLVRNEDNFSLALQSLDGTYHLLRKSDLEHIDYVTEPLMPSGYGSILSATEVNDLISYLMAVPGAEQAQPPEKSRARRGEDE